MRIVTDKLETASGKCKINICFFKHGQLVILPFIVNVILNLSNLFLNHVVTSVCSADDSQSRFWEKGSRKDFSNLKPATHLAILYADRRDRRKSLGVPGAAIAIFADHRIKSPISGMSDIGD